MTENYLDILADTIRNNWNQPALTDFYLTEDGSAQDTSRGNHYTYGEMYAEIVRIADRLTTLGLEKGDHIAICGANSAHWVIAYLAIAKMQCVAVTIQHSLTLDEIAHFVNFSDAKAIFVDVDIWDELSILQPSNGNVSQVISLADWSLLYETYVHSCMGDLVIARNDVSFPTTAYNALVQIGLTSGSTNIPKGIMLPYCSICNNVSNLIEKYQKDKNTHYIVFSPLARPGVLSSEMIVQLCRGKHIFIFQDLFSIENIFQSLKVVAPYMFFAVPKVLSLLMHNHNVKELSTIKQILTGGALSDPQTEKKVIEYHVPVSNTYGITEAGQLISLCAPNKYRFSSAGELLGGIDLKISPSGEILVKGDNVMLGYYKDPEATAAKIDKDGWLHTGDKGHLDEDGYLYVEGRLEQDMIVLPNGENIRPEHIESLINALPNVSESIVLARDGKLVAIVVSQITNADLKRNVLHQINPQLPLFSQLYNVEITDQPLQRTEKQTLKRYLYH